jgi:putative ABC transport system substrate-binding protein
MRRREFLTLLGGAAVAWPLAARAQPGNLPVVGYLNSARELQYRHLTAAFRKGLAEGGFTEGRNVAVEYRWGEGDYTRLPALAGDLVSRNVAVIVAHAPPAAKGREGGDRHHSHRLHLGRGPGPDRSRLEHEPFRR